MLKGYKILAVVFLILGIASIIFIQNGIAENGDFESRQAIIKSLKGSVKIKKAGTERWITANRGMKLSQNDTIKTDSNSRAELVFPSKKDESGVQIYKNTEVTIQQLITNKKTGEEGTVLDVAVGKILVKAAKLKGESKFEVATPTSIVGVRGTEFEVTVSAP